LNQRRLAYSAFMERTNPFTLFDTWYAEAQVGELNDPNAMALATAGADGQPSCRMVLLKGHGPDGFVFYTNLGSAKSDQLNANGKAALLFHWKSLRRQIRIEGTVSAVSDAEADAYFASRSRNSQLGARASDQSRPLDSRATFEARFAAEEARFEGIDVPRPSDWSGWRVTPHAIEFWQDREFRLHERWRYVRNGDDLDGKSWTSGMLYP
jgi:pyridoxamine 5'-phosphate oxidase